MDSVVAPADRLDANAVVNATEPPELAVPLTTRNALSLCVVDLVHPVGADVCTNSITVPEAKAAAEAQVNAEPFQVKEVPAVVGASAKPEAPAPV